MLVIVWSPLPHFLTLCLLLFLSSSGRDRCHWEWGGKRQSAWEMYPSAEVKREEIDRSANDRLSRSRHPRHKCMAPKRRGTSTSRQIIRVSWMGRRLFLARRLRTAVVSL